MLSPQKQSREGDITGEGGKWEREEGEEEEEEGWSKRKKTTSLFLLLFFLLLNPRVSLFHSFHFFPRKPRVKSNLAIKKNSHFLCRWFFVGVQKKNHILWSRDGLSSTSPSPPSSSRSLRSSFSSPSKQKQQQALLLRKLNGEKAALRAPERGRTQALAGE